MPTPPPDFSAGSGPQFSVQGSDQLSSRLGQANQGLQNVNYDWSGVNALLQHLQGQQGGADARAQGQGLTAGDETRMGQEDLGAGGNDPASLGKALMRLGSKAAGAQAGQAGAAEGQQQMQAMQQATQLKQAQAQARLNVYKQELQLQDQKFQIARATQQAQDGVDMANLQLKNLYNQMIAGAKNAQDLGNVRVTQDQFNNTMSYIGAGLGAASSITAAGAAAMGGAPSTSQGINGNTLQATGQPGTYAGMTATGGTGGYDTMQAAVNTDDFGKAFYNP